MSHTTWLQNQQEVDEQGMINLRELVKEKGNTCVSIIVPTHRMGQDRQGDLAEVKRAMQTAKKALRFETGNFLVAMDGLFQQINFNRNKDGIGIFISPHVRRLVHFPFPVTRKITVNHFFHLEDLIYVENYRIPYFVLGVSKKEIHLFKGVMDHLEEIRDGNFPAAIKEEYEYSKPSRGSSIAGHAHLKSFEKDKSELQRLRMVNALKKIDKSLGAYVVKADIPLILCGVEKHVAVFKSVTAHSSNVVASIGNNYEGTGIRDLELLAWIELRRFIDRQKLELVNEFKENLGRGLGCYGVENVWSASRQGKGLKLLVEKDLGKPVAAVSPSEKAMMRNQDLPSDVVNHIINTVLEKNGEVIVMEKTELSAFDGIALINRY